MSAFGPDMPAYAELTAGVRRLVAPNPSMMTGPGTNTYLLGGSEVAVLDPGPAMDEHIGAIVGHVGDGNFHAGYLVEPGNADQLKEAKRLAARLDPACICRACSR